MTLHGVDGALVRSVSAWPTLGLTRITSRQLAIATEFGEQDAPGTAARAVVQTPPADLVRGPILMGVRCVRFASDSRESLLERGSRALCLARRASRARVAHHGAVGEVVVAALAVWRQIGVRMRVATMARQGWRSRLGALLIRWGAALQPVVLPPPAPAPGPSAEPEPDPLPPPQDRGRGAPLAKRPGVRAPLSVERAVLSRDLAVLKREATDALAALGAAHAVVTSARLAQVQNVRSEVQAGHAGEDDLVELAGDYQAWQNDQVRLFDALALVLGMPVPEGRAFDQIDPSLTAPARAHLSALAAEYQRRLLSDQFASGDKEG